MTTQHYKQLDVSDLARETAYDWPIPPVTKSSVPTT